MHVAKIKKKGLTTVFFLSLLFIIVLVVIDQITKHLAVDYLKPIGNTNVIPNFLDFTYVQNDGAAFGMMSDARWVFIIGTILVVIVMLYLLCKGEFKHILGKISVILSIAGGVGNLIDRLALGYVIDFIDISPLFPFAVFNFADSCVTVGACLLIIFILFFYDKQDKKSYSKDKDTEETSVVISEE